MPRLVKWLSPDARHAAHFATRSIQSSNSKSFGPLRTCLRRGTVLAPQAQFDQYAFAIRESVRPGRTRPEKPLDL